MTGSSARREGKSPRMSRAALSLASLVLLAAAGASAPAFRLQVPEGMSVGRVALRAEAADPRVAAVSWTVEDTTRTLPSPFTLVLDVGPVPQEKRVLAVALDRDRKALYRKEAVLNPGERALYLEILSPLEGSACPGLSRSSSARPFRPATPWRASPSRREAGRSPPPETATTARPSWRCPTGRRPSRRASGPRTGGRPSGRSFLNGRGS